MLYCHFVIILLHKTLRFLIAFLFFAYTYNTKELFFLIKINIDKLKDKYEIIFLYISIATQDTLYVFF